MPCPDCNGTMVPHCSTCTWLRCPKCFVVLNPLSGNGFSGVISEEA